MEVRLDGETRLFLIIGDPIGQVRSPRYLTEIVVQRGANMLVVPAHVTTADLPAFMDSVRLMRNLDGIIATIPHKFALLGYADAPSERAAFIGSANILRRSSEGWTADNLDGVGYLDGISRLGFDIAGRRALLTGAGGAGSAIAYEILARGAAALAIHDIDTGRRDALVRRLAARFGERVGPGGTDPTGYDLVANASPSGMNPGDPLPVDAGRLAAGQFVADVITKPDVSPLVERARALGCRTMTGAGMFDAQAELLVDVMLAEGGGHAT